MDNLMLFPRPGILGRKQRHLSVNQRLANGSVSISG